MTTSATETGTGAMTGASPAPLVRIFGWTNLALMFAFLANAVLMFYFNWPGLGPLFGGGSGSTGLAAGHVAIYAAALAVVVVYVLTCSRDLRTEAKTISDANAFFIRACFWTVCLVGISDAVISFIRVEGMLEGMVGNNMAIALGKSDYRGLWVHIPSALLGVLIATRTRTLGFHWLALLVVVAELLIVFSRFIFSYEQAFMADLVRFWYAALFLFASAYTLLEDGHVRVDVLYAGFRQRARGRVNALGSVLLGMTLCWTVLLIGFWNKSSIIISPILVFETTQTGFGMYVKYFMAGFLGVFGVSMMLQFVSYLFESVADWRNEAGGRPDHHSGHIG